MSAVTLPQFHLVRKMLASQVRHVEIARELNLSVWTISRIATDLRREHDTEVNPGAHAGIRHRTAQAVPPDLERTLSSSERGARSAELITTNSVNGSVPRSEFPAPSLPADLPEDDAPPDYVATNLRRCPGCGGMVYQWPCLTCRLRTPLAGTKPGPGEAPTRPPLPTRTSPGASLLPAKNTKDQPP